jgi:hypothetical protein
VGLVTSFGGSVVMIGGSLKMLYDDANFVASNWQIGFAKSFFKPISVEQEIIMPTEFAL